MSMQFTHAIRGNFFDIAACVEQPDQLGPQLRHRPDGLLLLNQGRIAWFGEWQQGAALLPAGTTVTDYRDKLVVPGFVDCHIHYPQTEMIGAYGDQLLGGCSAIPSRSRDVLATPSMPRISPHSSCSSC
ncbi:Guanine deaminase [Serratia rubidaea]|uniref:Guanine deaminase n=1 Tax=Serratia rubidaea TaxID=61652 RepID=A0A447QUZ4_SERRU|nr:Guanine deaminase [Serratia rubidaea]